MLLVVALLVGGGVYLAFDDRGNETFEPDKPDFGVTDTSGGGGQRKNNNPGHQPIVGKSGQYEAGGPGGKVAGGGNRPDHSKPGQPQLPQPDPHDYSAFPASEYPGLTDICKELGWFAGSPEVERLATWMRANKKLYLAETIMKFMEKNHEDPEKAVLLYNEKAMEHREALRQMLGGFKTEEIHKVIPLYRIVDHSGQTERVDINGERVD